MIGLNRLKRAIADVPTSGMQTGDPKVKIKICDAMLIEAEFNAVATERDTLKQQNAELAAQVEMLRETIYNTIKACNNNSGNEPSISVYHKALNDAADAWRKTPAQCLLEVKADAIDYFANEVCGNCASGFQAQLSRVAEQYANKIRGGKS